MTSPRTRRPSPFRTLARWLATGRTAPPRPSRAAVRERQFDDYVRANRGPARAA